jgi:hypothetical protein
MKTINPRILTISLCGFSLLASSVAFGQSDSTKTSSLSDANINFPEDGYAIPRAGTPQAGHGDKMDRSQTPEGGTKTDWRHQGTPPGPTSATKTSFEWKGYLRVIGQYTQNDALPYIGRNDGFRLGNARIELNTKFGEKLGGIISLETSSEKAEGANDANATFDVGLRDAYLHYKFSDLLAINFGRFKAPYDLGELESTQDRIFIDAPVETRGISRTRGIEAKGLSQGRQLGLSMGTQRLGLSEHGFDIGYIVALTNGKTGNMAFNDNDRPAGFLRLSAYFGDLVRLNLGGFVDSRSDGELPNQFEEETKGAEASVQFEMDGLRLEVQALAQMTTFTTTGEDDTLSLGFHGQWAYRISDFEVAYRFAYFDPNDRYDADMIMEHTLGASYFCSDAPLRFSINGTFADEQYPVDNHRAEILAQYVF